jgi:hypothetical protein
MTPLLVEGGFKQFIHQSLRQCRAIRQEYMNNVFNILLLFFLLFGIFAFLYFNYKGKLSEED